VTGTATAAVDTTRWIIAIGSLGSALIALALALGLKDWFYRPQLRLVLRHASDPVAALRRMTHCPVSDQEVDVSPQ
jgi:hypothetical protein